MKETDRFYKMTSRLPDLEALAIFARIVEHGSFSGAAQALGLSRPTVSKAIGRLEQTTGTALFNRTSRQFSLTDTGHRILDHAVRLLGEGEAAEAELRRAVLHPHGVLRITAPVSFGLSHVAPLLPAFLQAYPEITLAVSYSDEQVDLIGGGFDLAIRIAVHAPSSLRALRLCSIPLLLVATPAYLEREGRPVHPRDLAHHNGFLYTSPGAGSVFRLSCGQETLLADPPRSRYAANNSEAFLPALMAGLGIGIFPDFMIASALQDGSLERVLPDWSLPVTELSLLTPPGTQHPARVSAFLDHIGARLKRAPWRNRS